MKKTELQKLQDKMFEASVSEASTMYIPKLTCLDFIVLMQTEIEEARKFRPKEYRPLSESLLMAIFREYAYNPLYKDGNIFSVSRFSKFQEFSSFNDFISFLEKSEDDYYIEEFQMLKDVISQYSEKTLYQIRDIFYEKVIEFYSSEDYAMTFEEIYLEHLPKIIISLHGSIGVILRQWC